MYHEAGVLRGLVLLLALFWGISWAVFLQFVPIGQFLARRRAWLAVVVGVGVDLLLMWPLLPLESWLLLVAVVALSGVGIVFRSLWNEHRETEAEIDVIAGE